MNLGTRIAEKRAEKGISQEKLAEKLGVSRAYLSYIENGVKVPTLAMFAQIAKELDASAEWLLFGNDRKLNA